MVSLGLYFVAWPFIVPFYIVLLFKNIVYNTVNLIAFKMRKRIEYNANVKDVTDLYLKDELDENSASDLLIIKHHNTKY
jgi:hypothetical protein